MNNNTNGASLQQYSTVWMRAPGTIKDQYINLITHFPSTDSMNRRDNDDSCYINEL